MPRLIRKPFKGIYFYEWQIGPFVLQLRHNDFHRHSAYYDAAHHALRRFAIWRDPYWK